VRAELSALIGMKDGGFYDRCAEEIVNLRIRDGALTLRDGISKGFSLSGDIVFAQSVVCNGSTVGFISDSNAMYALHTYTTNEEPDEPVFYSGVYPDRAFVFSTGKNIYLYNEGEFYVFDGADFKAAEFAAPVLFKVSPDVSGDEIGNYTNLLTGVMDVAFTLKEDASFILFEDEVSSVISATIGGEDISERIRIDGRAVYVDGGIKAGELLTLCIAPSGAENFFPDDERDLIFGVTSDTGEGYVYGRGAIYPVRDFNGELFISYPVFVSEAKNIKACFFCSGLLAAAVGNSIGLVKNGVFSAISGEGIESRHSVCEGGGCAYLNTGEHIARLSFSLSGSTYDVNYVTTNDSLTERGNHDLIGMTYSPSDRCVYAVMASRYASRTKELYSYDTQSGIWMRTEGIESPSFCLPLDDSFCVTSGKAVYFIVTGQGYDSDFEFSYPIEGRIVLCASDFGVQADKKRLLSASASLSGLCESFTLKVVSDSGMSDSFTYTCDVSPAREAAFPVYRMGIGRFSHASVEASIRGYSGAAIHDVYFDVKNLK